MKDGENPVSAAGLTEISPILHLPDITLNWTKASPVKSALRLCVTVLKSLTYSPLVSISKTPNRFPYSDDSAIGVSSTSSVYKDVACAIEEPDT